MGEPARLRGERTATAVLLRSGPMAGFVVVVVCLLAVPLVPLGLWRPVIVWPVVALAVLVGWRLVRGIPIGDGPPVPVWTALSCVLLAGTFTAWAGLTHGEHLVVRRDAGSYAMFAHWLATRHGLPVHADLEAFGGAAALAVPGFSLESPAFYQVLTGTGADTTAQVVPQFLLGAPALYSLGWWAGGWSGMFWVPAVLGGLGLLAAAGVAARVIGPRWALPAVAALALTQPVLHASRATLSEPAAMLLVLGAAALAIDALGTSDRGLARRLGAASGVLVGLAGLVRVDSVREVALLLPVAAVLALRRHPAALPLAGGAITGLLIAAIPAAWLSRPYLNEIASSLRPLVLATAALAAASALVVVVGRRWQARVAASAGSGSSPRPWWRPLSWAAGAGVLLLGGLLVTRPQWTVGRTADVDGANALIASLQQQQGLPIDGTRTYAEQSVDWLIWYVGPIAALAALIVLAVATARLVTWWGSGERQAPPWLVPVLVGLASCVLVLYRPGITPDHPWADRRLVPVVLPATTLAATAAAAWAVRWARRRLSAVLLVTVTTMALVALLAPAVAATAPLSRSRTEVGEPRAVAAVCASLQPGDVVLAVSDARGGIRAQNEWVQVVRGVCAHPAAALTGPVDQQKAAVAQVGALVAESGGRLVLLSAGEGDDRAQTGLIALGADKPHQAVLLRAREDQRTLMRVPRWTAAVAFDMWLAVWPSGAGG